MDQAMARNSSTDYRQKISRSLGKNDTISVLQVLQDDWEEDSPSSSISYDVGLSLGHDLDADVALEPKSKKLT